MLLNSYFTIINRETDGDSHTLSIRLLKEHPVYQGHFPGNPVSPGVCNMQMIKECAEEIVGKSLVFTTLSQYRLMAVVSPYRNENITLSLTVKNNDGKFDLVASALSGETQCISIKGSLVEI